MKAIVFGATGMVGQALYRHLQFSGWLVQGTSHPSETNDLIPFDIGDRSLERLSFAGFSIDVGFIAAAITSIDHCKRDVAGSRLINVDGIIRLAKWLTDKGVRPVFFSSDYVFSGDKGEYTEESVPDPITEYGKQKAEVESAFKESFPSGLVLRLSRVISSNPSVPGMLSDWWEAIRRGEVIRCASDQWFCPTDAEDVAEAARLLLEHGVAGLVNVCQPQKYCRKELLNKFVQRLGLRDVVVEEWPTERFGFADVRGRDTSLCPLRLKSLVGFTCASVDVCIERFAKMVESKFES